MAEPHYWLGPQEDNKKKKKSLALQNFFLKKRSTIFVISYLSNIKGENGLLPFFFLKKNLAFCLIFQTN